MTAHPAISIPFAFTADGLPVGLQLVGRYGDERGLLELAAGSKPRPAPTGGARSSAEARRRRNVSQA